MVIEPQGSIHVTLHHHHHPHNHHHHQHHDQRRRDDTTSTKQHASTDPEQRVLVQYDEPMTPSHPDLEFEVFAELEDHHAPDVAPPGNNETINRPSSTSSPSSSSTPKSPNQNFNLLVSFVLLVLAGSGNNVMAKLQAIPMYNYPNFLNLFVNAMYIPICFAYIIPVAKYGWFNQTISSEQMNMPKRPLMVMGLLDCISGVMQVFASVYLPGPLLVLLPQAAIPLSMLLSRYLLREQYRWTQYVGAAIVLVGVLVVLEPVLFSRQAPHYFCHAINMEENCVVCQNEVTQERCLSHYYYDYHYNETHDDPSDPPSWMRWQPLHQQPQRQVLVLGNMTMNETEADMGPFGKALCQWLPLEGSHRKEDGLVLIWSLVMVASTLPMTLSTIYKEMAMGADDALDPIYMNGWISVYQFLFSLVIAIPAGLLTSPMITPFEVPTNILDGLLCYFGHGTIDTGCHPDSWCSVHAALFVNLFLLCNLLYTFFMMYVLKFGSTSLFFLAVTVMVPLSNLIFCLPGMPQSTPIHSTDALALALILLGLVLYRFWDSTDDNNHDDNDGDNNSNRHHNNNSSSATTEDAANRVGRGPHPSGTTTGNNGPEEDPQQEQQQHPRVAAATPAKHNGNNHDRIDEEEGSTAAAQPRRNQWWPGLLDPLLQEPLLARRSDDV